VTPFAAGAPPAGWRFRARNQVIAALSQVLVVVEAEALSGSLSTARAARKLGRPVLALPGSAGCDRLLETGAASLCEDAGDVVKALGGERRRAAAALPAGADVVLAALTARAERADAVAARAGLAPGQVLAMLAELELSGHALRDASGRWLRSQVEVA